MYSRLIYPCIAVLSASGGLMQAEDAGKVSLKNVLIRSGGNHAVMETAVLRVKVNDTEFLLSHATQSGV